MEGAKKIFTISESEVKITVKFGNSYITNYNEGKNQSEIWLQLYNKVSIIKEVKAALPFPIDTKIQRSWKINVTTNKQWMDDIF